jgi:quinohemoprotein ethanol dehydrogenase
MSVRLYSALLRHVQNVALADRTRVSTGPNHAYQGNPAGKRSTAARVRRALIAAAVFAAIVFFPALARAQSDQQLDWQHYGNDLGNTRFQHADQINPSNVAKLQVAWVFHTGVLDKEASLEVSPIVVGSTMYVTSGHDDVFALDASTGAKKWEYHPISEMPPLDQLSICCGRANRGAAYGDGKVFLGRLDDVLVALDATTGAVAWKATVVDWHDRYSITMAPQFVNNLVIVGVSGGEFKVRGQAVAYDAATGKEVWRFFTTEPTTWAGNSWETGGASVWQTPSVDPDLGLLYLNTGNAAPDVSGENRAGMNLYSASIVALEVATGRLRWYFQEVHHDLWDYDAAQPTILFSFTRSGQSLPALGHCGKNGNYYILDRRTGVPIFPVTEVPVPTTPNWQHPWPTQPVSSVEPLAPLAVILPTPPTITVAPHYTPPREEEILIQPGDDGVCEFPPGAFSPRTKFVYYGARYEPTLFSSFPGNTSFLGSTFEEKVPGVTERDFGIFGATDTVTGKVVWKINVPQPAKSGLLVAGDLVFFGEGNGRFHAADASTGAVLWTFMGQGVPKAGGAQGAPVAYVEDGREFIVNAFGGNRADREEFPPNPVGDAIIAFSLPSNDSQGGRIVRTHSHTMPAPSPDRE